MACHQQAQQYLGAVKLPVLGIPRAPQVVRVRSLEVQRRDVVEDNVNAPAGGSGTVRERDLLDAVLYARLPQVAVAQLVKVAVNLVDVMRLPAIPPQVIDRLELAARSHKPAQDKRPEQPADLAIAHMVEQLAENSLRAFDRHL